MNSEVYSSQIHPSDTKLIGQHLTVEMVNELDHTALDVRFFFFSGLGLHLISTHLSMFFIY